METKYVYMKSEPNLWTVGFYHPNGKWEPESDHPTPEDAANRVAWLNGNYAAAPELLEVCKEMHKRHGNEIAGPHNTGSRPDICFLCDAIAKAEGK